ncbi:hypothetical protein GWI33_015049, partial [Rhynchophorus ferrugineus]
DNSAFNLICAFNVKIYGFYMKKIKIPWGMVDGELKS